MSKITNLVATFNKNLTLKSLQSQTSKTPSGKTAQLVDNKFDNDRWLFGGLTGDNNDNDRDTMVDNNSGKTTVSGNHDNDRDTMTDKNGKTNFGGNSDNDRDTMAEKNSGKTNFGGNYDNARDTLR